MDTQINIKMDKELLKKFKSILKKQGRTISPTIRYLIEQFIEKEVKNEQQQ